MKVMHLLVSGNNGGIEVLVKNYADCTNLDSFYYFAFSGGINADLMKKKGHHVIINQQSEKSKISMLYNLIRVIKANKVEVIVVHNSSTVMRLFCCVHKIIIPKVKFVLYAHSTAEEMYRKSIFLYYIVKISYIYCDKIVAISKSVKKSLIEQLNINPKKITVIYNGTPIIDSYNLNNKLTCNREKFIFVGRLIQEKGVQVILQGLTKISRGNDFSFTIVGDGPYRKNLEKLVLDCNLRNNVTFMGNRNDVLSILSRNGIFIHMPVWEEGFGITIIEAMAAGLICICAKSGAIPEIITDGVDGFLVDKYDTNAMTKKLLYVMYEANEDELLRIRNNAMKRAREFSIGKYAAKLDELILSVAEKSSIKLL